MNASPATLATSSSRRSVRYAGGRGRRGGRDMPRAQITTPEALPDERSADAALRPSRLDEFVGQAKVKESLQIAIDAAKQRREPLDHALFFGPPGLGKTTLALLMAKELGVNIRTTSGPVLERPGDLVGMLTSLEAGDILFIDEVHRLRPALEEFLYPAMEEYRVDVRIADGPHAQTIPMTLERFTLIGATTRFGLLTPPMRARFGLIERLSYYPPDDLAQIVTRSARILAVPIDAPGTAEIARRSRGTPRVANRLLKRVRDYAQVRADGKITGPVALEALKRLDVDEFGLDDMDARILKTIIEQFEGGPVGLQTIGAAVGEDSGTLEEVYEPFLMQQGFLARTPRGRVDPARPVQRRDRPRRGRRRGRFERITRDSGATARETGHPKGLPDGRRSHDRGAARAGARGRHLACDGASGREAQARAARRVRGRQRGGDRRDVGRRAQACEVRRRARRSGDGREIRGGALATLHSPRSHGHGPCALSDGVRRARRERRGADGGTALHDGAARPVARQGHGDRDARSPYRPGDLQAGGGGGSGTASHGARALRDSRRDGRGDQPGTGRGA